MNVINFVFRYRKMSDPNVSYYVPGYAVSYSSESAKTSIQSIPQPADNKVDMNVVRDRCRVAIEGRAGMVCYEGHGTKNRK